MTRIEVAPPEWLRDWLEEKGEALDEIVSDIGPAAHRVARSGMLVEMCPERGSP